ncbi:MAG: hypothetical protein QOH56_2355 [Pseudonocardiales bacterium]|nr:hypothetical protein [Pseudonocardiales bacterium]
MTERRALQVRLREVREEDLPSFFSYQSDPAAAVMAGFVPRDAEADAAHWHRIATDPMVIARTIVVENEVAGSIVSFGNEQERNLGYWISSAFWGKGTATRAAELFLQIETTRPLYAHVLKTNIGSQRVLAEIGFIPFDSDSEEFVVVLRQ